MPNYKVKHQCDGPVGKTCSDCVFYEAEDEEFEDGGFYLKEICTNGHDDYVDESAEACEDFLEE